MTETLVGVSPPSSSEDPPQEPVGEPRPPSAEELAAARELVKAARDRGVALTGPDGLLKALTKTVVETALDEEMSEHLGYDKHAVEGRNRENSRNGKRSKTLLTGRDRGRRRCGHRGPARPGRDVRPAGGQEATTPALRPRRGRHLALLQGP
jgi:hypothetical protein